MRYFSTVLFTLMASLAVAQPLRMPSEDLAKRHGGPAEITDEWGNVIYPKRPANLAERKAGPAEIAEVPDSELDKRVCDEGPLGRDCGNCMRPGGHCWADPMSKQFDHGSKNQELQNEELRRGDLEKEALKQMITK